MVANNPDKRIIRMVLPHETIRFAAQKVWFGRPKGMVLQCKRAHICNSLIDSGLQKVVEEVEVCEIV